MRKVFGVGFSKTGTTSLEIALQDFDLNVCRGHWESNHSNYLMSLFVNQDFEEIRRMTSYWDAYADAPWGGGDLYLKLHEWYPDAKFILTVRDPNKWFRSFTNMIKEHESEDGSFTEFHKNGKYGAALFFERIYKVEDIRNQKEKIISYYESINKSIEDYFKGNPNFIKIDLTANEDSENWIALAKFLEMSVPDKPFPHSNSTFEIPETVRPNKQRVKEKIVRVLKRIYHKI
jgi:hypothetical protein